MVLQEAGRSGPPMWALTSWELPSQWPWGVEGGLAALWKWLVWVGLRGPGQSPQQGCPDQCKPTRTGEPVEEARTDPGVPGSTPAPCWSWQWGRLDGLSRAEARG